MTDALLNRPRFSESLNNTLDARRTIRSDFAFVQSVLPDDVLDEILMADAVQRRGERPLSSYRTLEELMSEWGD